MNDTIYFDDLVANAIIEKAAHQKGRSITMSELNDYSERLKSWWLENKHISIHVALSHYDINMLFFEYPDFFYRHFDENNNLIICLKDGKNTDDLRKKFRSYLSVDMLLGFIQSYIKD